jgi:hypothetical protein
MTHDTVVQTPLKWEGGTADAFPADRTSGFLSSETLGMVGAASCEDLAFRAAGQWVIWKSQREGLMRHGGKSLLEASKRTLVRRLRLLLSLPEERCPQKGEALHTKEGNEPERNRQARWPHRLWAGFSP